MSLAGKTRLCSTSPKREQQELIVLTAVREGGTICQRRVEKLLNSLVEIPHNLLWNQEKQNSPQRNRPVTQLKRRKITVLFALELFLALPVVSSTGKCLHAHCCTFVPSVAPPPLWSTPFFFQGRDHVFPLRYTTWPVTINSPIVEHPVREQESQLRYPNCQIFQPTSRLYNNFTKQETTGYATCQIS